MYVPPVFAADDPEALAMLERTPFGALVTVGANGLGATQLPFLIEPEPLRLIGHVAKANSIWRSGAAQGLLIVQGADAYVSPSLYPSKAEHGRVVPTWNYEAAHVHGTLEWFEDRDRLLSVVERLTDRFEQARTHPWAVSDAPADYVETMLNAIVGVALRVTRIEAARKLSQNRSAADRAGVIDGLAKSSHVGDRAVAQAMQPRAMQT
jgi:transcriptional regulator